MKEDDTEEDGETIVRTGGYKFKAGDIIEAKVWFFLLQSVEEQAFLLEYTVNPKLSQSLKCHCEIAVLGIYRLSSSSRKRFHRGQCFG